MPDTGMDEANAHGYLPSVAVSIQPTGIINFDHVAVILPEAPYGSFSQAGDTSGNEERFGDERPEAFYRAADGVCDEHVGHVTVEGAHARFEGLEIDPGRHVGIDFLEEVAQDFRRFAQNAMVPLYAGLDERVQIIGREGGYRLHHRVQFGIAYGGVPDVVVSRLLHLEPGPGITFCVC